MTFDPVISLRQWQAVITTYLKVFFHIPFKDQYQLLQERGETENQILLCGLVCPEQNLRQEAKHIKTCETSVPDREKAQRKCTEWQREAQSFRQGNRGKHTQTHTRGRPQCHQTLLFSLVLPSTVGSSQFIQVNELFQ